MLHMLVKERNLFLKAALQMLDNNASNNSVTNNSYPNNINSNNHCYGYGNGNGLQSHLTDPNQPPQPYNNQLPSSTSISPLQHGHHGHTHQRGSGMHSKSGVNSMSSDGNAVNYTYLPYKF
jgi:hypothetical protein